MDTPLTIIGAGCVGAAAAYTLREKFPEAVILEKNERAGAETSERNSGVIHAGLYYPEGSLKARLCVEGNRMIYDYCEKNNIPHQKCGKLIIAVSEDEIPDMEALYEKGLKNGCTLEIIGKDKIDELEPDIKAVKAIYSPLTGIFDTAPFIESLIANSGMEIFYKSEAKEIKKIDGGYEISVESSENYTFTTEKIINCAGLWCDRVSENAGI